MTQTNEIPTHTNDYVFITSCDDFSEEALNVLFDKIEKEEESTGVQAEFSVDHFSRTYREEAIDKYFERIVLRGGCDAYLKRRDKLNPYEAEGRKWQVVRQAIDAYNAFVGFTKKGTVVYKVH